MENTTVKEIWNSVNIVEPMNELCSGTVFLLRHGVGICIGLWAQWRSNRAFLVAVGVLFLPDNITAAAIVSRPRPISYCMKPNRENQSFDAVLCLRQVDKNCDDYRRKWNGLN